jgi:hypothetical protein
MLGDALQKSFVIPNSIAFILLNPGHFVETSEIPGFLFSCAIIFVKIHTKGEKNTMFRKWAGDPILSNIVGKKRKTGFPQIFIFIVSGLFMGAICSNLLITHLDPIYLKNIWLFSVLWVSSRAVFAVLWLLLFRILEGMVLGYVYSFTYDPSWRLSYDNPEERAQHIRKESVGYWIGGIGLAFLVLFILPEIALRVSYFIFH